MSVESDLQPPKSINEGKVGEESPTTIEANQRTAELSALVCVLVCLVTFITYFGVTKLDFVAFDDPLYVTNNQHVMQGLTMDGMTWAFQSIRYFYHPVTWLSLMLDAQAWGSRPGGFHLTNLLIHTINVALLFLLIRELFGSLSRAALVALLFGIHPCNVETIAWVAERKGLLAGFFCISTLHVYYKFCRHPTIWRYVLVFIMFLMGLMCKPSLITLPIALFLIDFWLYRQRDRRGGYSNLEQVTKSLLNKLPLMFASGLFCLLNYVAELNAHSVVPFEHYSLTNRLGNALISIPKYLCMTIVPGRLWIPYVEETATNDMQFVVGSIIVLISSAALLRNTNLTLRHIVVGGWLWFIILILPVLGIVKVGHHTMADRYLYIPAIGSFLALGFLLHMCTSSCNRQLLRPSVLGASAVFICLSALTIRQVSYWRNTSTLFKHTLDCSPDNYIAHLVLARYAENRSEDSVAEYHFRSAVCQALKSPRAHLETADYYLRKRKPIAAFEVMRDAVRAFPRREDLRHGLALRVLNSTSIPIKVAKTALAHAHEACISDQFRDPIYVNTLARCHAQLGRFTDAIVISDVALRIAIEKSMEPLAQRIRGQIDYYKAMRRTGDASQTL